MTLRALSSRALLLFLVVIMAAIAVAGILFSGVFSIQFGYFQERIELALNPSADRAFEYGVRHFSPGVHSAEYDLDHAAYFLKQAVAIDPEHAQANQQLARVKFIRGDFHGAIANINQAITLQGDRSPSAYYIRGLIRGFQAHYESAAEDFAHYVRLNPSIWAGYNDLAWVLMKSDDYERALDVLSVGLEKFPENAWLLNSYAIALYETGDTAGAQAAALLARDAVEKLTPQDWSTANPGNDPRIAGEGLETFRNATLSNLEKILSESASSEIEVVR